MDSFKPREEVGVGVSESVDALEALDGGGGRRESPREASLV